MTLAYGQWYFLWLGIKKKTNPASFAAVGGALWFFESIMLPTTAWPCLSEATENIQVSVVSELQLGEG